MAKKAPAKRKPKNAVVESAAELADLSDRMKEALKPAKRKPRPKKPDTLVVPIVEIPGWLIGGLKAVLMLVIGGLGGIWIAGGIPIGPGPSPVQDDSLSTAYTADRATQITVLRELAAQPFDGETDDGRRKAGEWFNAQRFRNRSDDFGQYTDEVSEAIAANAEAELAKKLEGK
jgi:hypothetical protein